MIVFTLILALSGLMQIGLLIFQAVYGWRATSAAKRSTEAAEDALKLAHRAYVFIEKGKLEFVGYRSSPTGTLIVTYKCTLHNAGHTPATLVGYFFGTVQRKRTAEPAT